MVQNTFFTEPGQALFWCNASLDWGADKQKKKKKDKKSPHFQAGVLLVKKRLVGEGVISKVLKPAQDSFVPSFMQGATWLGWYHLKQLVGKQKHSGWFWKTEQMRSWA